MDQKEFYDEVNLAAWASEALLDTDARIRALVKVGVLKEGYYANEYKVVRPTRIVKAGFKKLGTGAWIPLCSNHPDIYNHSGGFTSPESCKNAWHFSDEHKFDKIEWDELPPTVEISYRINHDRPGWEELDALTASCSACEETWTNSRKAFEGENGIMRTHVKYGHGGDLVIFGTMPQKHEHVWHKSFPDNPPPTYHCSCGAKGKVVEV